MSYGVSIFFKSIVVDADVRSTAYSEMGRISSRIAGIIERAMYSCWNSMSEFQRSFTARTSGVNAPSLFFRLTMTWMDWPVNAAMWEQISASVFHWPGAAAVHAAPFHQSCVAPSRLRRKPSEVTTVPAAFFFIFASHSKPIQPLHVAGVVRRVLANRSGAVE